MPEKHPIDYDWITYLWVFGISIWGGIVHHALRNKKLVLWLLLRDIVVSAFVGLITFYLCEATNIKPLYTAVMVAISANMGSRIIYQYERLVVKRLFPDTISGLHKDPPNESKEQTKENTSG